MARIVPLFVSLAVGVVLVSCGSEPQLPSFVGQKLDAAKLTARDAGFDSVVSQDATGSRNQYVDANWQVCTQSPQPGPVDQDDTVTLGVVKNEEFCPGTGPPPTSTSPTPSPTPEPIPTSEPTGSPPSVVEPSEPDTGSGNDDDSGSGLVVNPGSYCDPTGSVGVTKSGKPMVCRGGSDGRNRWRSG